MVAWEPNIYVTNLKPNIMKNVLLIVLMICTCSAFAQINPQGGKESDVPYKYRVSTPWIILPQFVTTSWNDRKNTQHIELHIKRNLDNKNIIGIKFATWRL